METRVSERKVIIFTAVLIILAGLVKLISYKVGIVLFYLPFLAFITYRTYYYFKLRGKQKTQLERYRLMVIVSMIITIILNIVGIQDVEFFLLVLLMIDFLMVINRKG